MSEENIVEEIKESTNDHVVETPREEVIKRGVAYLIDIIIYSIILSIFGLGFLGNALAAAFMLLRDVIFEGQSPGKKLMKLKVVDRSGLSIGRDYMASIKRNILFLIPSGPYIFGFIEGMLLLFGDKIPVMGEKIRIGDKIAGTDVVDA